ncbi:hypothetical protein Pth03_71940 [Planotetraspora thailandica]|uniref:Heavy metal-binding domain-containing protein n=1 Tax=Planotetraspora thailandica TaxID=487172 RepID=A0A8J3Y0X6_9ACTN|nr:hypothetical protein [Planotetraspora thailandica]GII58805.1 hypothetical protein Pth03_71940 [Planotetraspora thailandica]
MNPVAKLGVYALGLVVIFGVALGVGSAVDPAPAASRSNAGPHDAGGHDGGHDGGHATAEPAGGHVPGGLQTSQDGYTLVPQTTTLIPGKTAEFRFTVTGPDGRPVTAYRTEHDKKLHLIVVSRDLGDYRHLHPEEAGGGVWSTPLTLPEAGVYRAFADFAPDRHAGLTLGADLFAPGPYTPRALPAAGRTADVDGYTVSLAGTLTPGTASRLTLTVTEDGTPVTDLEPYLGAYGHLVALRAGDLAYLHVHPDETGKAGPEVTFEAEVPSGGDYRLFFDFQHGGVVRTAAFTVKAG